MRVRWPALLAVALYLSGDPQPWEALTCSPAQAAPESERDLLKDLQGTWDLVGSTENGQVEAASSIKGKHMVVTATEFIFKVNNRELARSKVDFHLDTGFQ